MKPCFSSSVDEGGGLSSLSPHQAAPSRAFVPFQHLFSSAVASNVSHDALEDCAQSTAIYV